MIFCLFKIACHSKLLTVYFYYSRIQFKIILLRGKYEQGKPKPVIKDIHKSQVVKLIHKHSVGEGLLVEMVGIIPKESSLVLKQLLKVGTRVDAVLKYSNKIFAKIRFDHQNLDQDKCISKKVSHKCMHGRSHIEKLYYVLDTHIAQHMFKVFVIC